MGKLITFLTILIVVDMFMIMTGQLCTSGTCSVSSTIFNAIFNVGQLSVMDWFKQILGDIGSMFSGGTSGTGLWSFLAGLAVSTGLIFTLTDTKLFVPLGITLGVLTQDFVLLYAVLKAQSYILATIVMAPITILFVLVVVEWVRGKD